MGNKNYTPIDWSKAPIWDVKRQRKFIEKLNSDIAESNGGIIENEMVVSK